MVKIFARIKRPSLRWGLMFGIILGVVGILYNFAVSFVTDANTQQLLDYIPSVLFLVLGFYAGMRASQETGKWISGLAAGLWVGVIGALVTDIIPLVNTLINLQSIVVSEQLYIQAHPSQFGNLKPADYTASDVIITTLLGVVFSIANAAIFTSIGGALGGFTGRRRSLAVSQNKTYEESLFEPPAAEKAARVAEDKESESTATGGVTEPGADNKVEPAEVKDEAAP